MAGIMEAPRNIGYVRSTVIERAEQFQKDFLKGSELRVTDQKTIQLVKDLQGGRFWGVLYALDGSSNPLQPDDTETRDKKRAWARKMFSPEEIDAITQMSIDIATTAPLNTQWPGTGHGHNILYHAFVAENPGSIFEGKVSEQLRRRIVNGSFWELIPEITPLLKRGIENMEDLFKTNYDDLDIQFATEGYELFERNGGKRNAPALIYMSEGKFSEYARFIGQVDSEHEELGLTSVQMGFLTEPIIRLGSHESRRETRRMLIDVGSI